MKVLLTKDKAPADFRHENVPKEHEEGPEGGREVLRLSDLPLDDEVDGLLTVALVPGGAGVPHPTAEVVI